MTTITPDAPFRTASAPQRQRRLFDGPAIALAVGAAASGIVAAISAISLAALL